LENIEEPPDRQREKLEYIRNILNEIFRDKSQRKCLDSAVQNAIANPLLLTEYSRVSIGNESDFNTLFSTVLRSLGPKLCNHFTHAPSEKTASQLVYPIIRKTYSDVCHTAQ